MPAYLQFLGQPSAYLSALVMIVVVALQGLVALWAANSEKPWLVRAFIVWLAIVALVPIGVHNFALVFTFSSFLTIAAVTEIRRWIAWFSVPAAERASAWSRWRWHFRLADLLVLTMLVATVIVLARDRPQFLIYAPIMAVPLSILTVLADLTAAGPRRMLKGVLLVSGTLLFVVVLHGFWLHPQFLRSSSSMTASDEWHWAAHNTLFAALALSLAFAWQLRRGWRSDSRPREYAFLAAAIAAEAIAILMAVFYADIVDTSPLPKFNIGLVRMPAQLGLLIALIVAGSALARVAWRDEPGWPRTAARAAACLSVAAVGAPLAWLYWNLLWLPPLPPPPPSDGPNHYYRLVEIVREVSGNSTFARQRKQALLDEAVLLLEAQNYIPTEVVADESRAMETGRALRGRQHFLLPVELIREAEEHDAMGKEAEAVGYALAVVRLETMFDRGGAYHPHGGYHAVRLLAKWRGSLSPESLRRVIDALERSLAEREPEAVVLARQAALRERSGDWHSRLQHIFYRLTARPPYTPPPSIERQSTETAFRLLQTDFAIRLFQLDRGRAPASLAELVPDYLPAVPIDPFSGQPLVYRVKAGKPVVYSVGPDEVDDGGLFLDPKDRPGAASEDWRVESLAP
jgi:hypothetical protein